MTIIRTMQTDPTPDGRVKVSFKSDAGEEIGSITLEPAAAETLAAMLCETAKAAYERRKLRVVK